MTSTGILLLVTICFVHPNDSTQLMVSVHNKATIATLSLEKEFKELECSHLIYPGQVPIFKSYREYSIKIRHYGNKFQSCIAKEGDYLLSK